MTRTAAPIDPARAPPAMEQRPICLYCGKRLAPFLAGGYSYPADNPERLRYWTGAYQGYQNSFHTLQEALAFACAAARAGYRMKK